jgi:hypothetical protein
MVIMRRKEGYMKKRNLFIVLLLSVLMISVLGLTAFADEHTHTWEQKVMSGIKNGVAYRCTDKTCQYYYADSKYGSWNRIKMEAADAYSGVPYDENNITLTYESEDIPEDISLSDPVYYKNGETKPLDNPPEEAGEYTAAITLIVNGKETVTMSDDFVIEQFKVEAEKGYPGYDVTPKYLWLGTSIKKPEDLEDGMLCTFEYLSLDNAKAEYTDEMPVNAGHYRVKATLYRYGGEGEDFTIDTVGIATDEFEIRKITGDDIKFMAFYVTDKEAMSKIDPEVYLNCKTAQELREVLFDLEQRKIITFWLAYTGNIPATYGDPLFVLAYVDEGDYDGNLYSSKVFGKMLITYEKKVGDKTVKYPFVQGVTKPDFGDTDLKFTIYASKNNEKIEKTVTVHFDKAEPEWVEKPKAIEGLEFNDTYQDLVNPGKVKNGTVYYALGNDGKFSESVPTAKDIGDYVVRYYVKPANDNYKETEIEYLNVSIAEAKSEAEDEDEDEFDFLAPGQVKLVKVAKITRKSAEIKFRRVSDAESYEYVITNKKGKTVQKGSVEQDITTFLKVKVKDLDKNTKYKVKVRAVKTVKVDGKDEVHKGDWSKTVSFKTKK